MEIGETRLDRQAERGEGWTRTTHLLGRLSSGGGFLKGMGRKGGEGSRKDDNDDLPENSGKGEDLCEGGKPRGEEERI